MERLFFVFVYAAIFASEAVRQVISSDDIDEAVRAPSGQMQFAAEI